MSVNSVSNARHASINQQPETLRQTQAAAVDRPQLQTGDSFAPQNRIENLRSQGAQTRHNLVLAQAARTSERESVYRNPPVTINDPIVGQFSFGQRNVTGPFSAPGSNPASPAAGDPAAIDAARNGNAYRVVAPNANPNQTPVLFVNGINTDLAGARRTAAEVSRLTGAPVDLAYNASSSTVALNRTLAHFQARANREAVAAVPARLQPDPNDNRFVAGVKSRARDAWIATDTQRRVAGYALSPESADWGKRNAIQNPPTAQTTANLILEQLNNTNGPVNVVAYSQGGAITTEALRRLENQGVDVSRVRVLAIGAAADTGVDAPELTNDFPANVRVSSFAHETDGISQYFGENRNNFNGWTAWNQGLDRGRFTQHTNYFRGQGAGAAADPNAERLLQRWYAGNSFSFRVLPDVE